MGWGVFCFVFVFWENGLRDVLSKGGLMDESAIHGFMSGSSVVVCVYVCIDKENVITHHLLSITT